MAKSKTRVVRIYNSSKQMIPLQVRIPGSEFYTGESQVRIDPGKDALLPFDHLRSDQLENLKRRGMIRILYDSQAAEDQEAAVTP
jgi:hypothetical protein